MHVHIHVRHTTPASVVERGIKYLQKYFPLNEADSYAGHSYDADTGLWTVAFHIEKELTWNQRGWLALHRDGGSIASYEEIAEKPAPVMTTVSIIGELRTIAVALDEEYADRLEAIADFLADQALPDWVRAEN